MTIFLLAGCAVDGPTMPWVQEETASCCLDAPKVHVDVYRTTPLRIDDGSLEAIGFDAEKIDTHDMHSPIFFIDSRLKVRPGLNGRYFVFATVYYADLFHFANFSINRTLCSLCSAG